MSLPWNKKPDWCAENKTFTVDELTRILLEAEIRGLHWVISQMEPIRKKRGKE